MEHSCSEFLSPAVLLRHAYNRVMTMNNRLAQEASETLAQVIFDLNSSPPRQPMRAVVDNTTSESADIDPGLKNSLPAQERTLQEVTTILARVIFDLNSSPPRQPMRAVVDNTTSESADIDHSIADVIGDVKIDGHGCSVSTGVITPFQALPERDIPKDEVDAAKSHEADYEAWTQLLDLMKQADSAKDSKLRQTLAPAITSQFQTLTQGRFDAIQLSAQLGTEEVVIGSTVGTPSSTTINNAGGKSALVIENDKSLLTVIKQVLKHEGYVVVRSARDRAEGLSLYSRCAPFDVVLIDYYVPQTVGIKINCFAPQKDAIELAKAIRAINPLQKMVIAAFDYEHPDEVPRPPELMHVPVMVSPPQLRELLEKLQFWATREEIDQAIAALSPADLQKLKHSATFRVRGLGSTPRGTWEDLLGEAQLSTFEGAQGNGSGRRWNKRVDFVTYLRGAMRSIADHSKDKFDREVLECEAVKCDGEGQELSLLDNLGPGDTPNERIRVALAEGFQPAAERRLIAKERVGKIFGMFKDDREATLVLEGWSEDMQKNEIMQKYELSARQYDAATKRIRAKMLGPRHSGGEA